MTTVPPEHFDRLFGSGPDPYGFRTRWYERRKYALTLAVLSRPRYARGLEVGCAEGALTEQLAGRCDRLDAVDGSGVAVERAARAMAAHPEVHVSRAVVPGELPPGPYDLVVLSEVGYFLSAADLDRLAARITAALAPGGELAAVHWRHPSDLYPLTGDEVHERLDAEPRLDPLTRLVEPDVVMTTYRVQP
ncbi:MAG TPA: class I SAM-dependent methyltransferase [Jiangellales bacterium]|nr:class I SAM-dependent methyltransferase [Jiangellales bacterium]